VADSSRCARCGCDERDHDPMRGLCLDPDCSCVQFVSEDDEMELDLEDMPRGLYLGEDDDDGA
jgi:hypothetical protein